MKKSVLVGKSLVAVSLVAAMAVPLSAPVFAAESEPGIETFSNRYEFVTEKGKEHLFYTITKTATQLAAEGAIVDTINGVCDAVMGEGGSLDIRVSAAVVRGLTAALKETQGVGKAAKIKVYSRTDVKYRIDSLTGKKQAYSSTYYMIYELYQGNDTKPYYTRTESHHQ